MRSHYCGQVNESLIGQEVELCGWINRRRDHGGVIFIELRDREGIVQIVYDPDIPDVFATAEKIRNEFVVRVKGVIRNRPDGMVNKKIPTGAIEILGKELEIINKSETPPFHNDEEVGEDIRLKYRYIDLRRPEMLKKIRLRSDITSKLRRFLDDKGFLDIETPMLTKATPEGARDYLVPSRTHQGSFFALPQSPQIFKQLLMMSGMDRYYQIVRCFRDEDLRADRQPEFTQLDIETTFLSEEHIITLMEEMMRTVFSESLSIELPNPFPRMTYKDAMLKYGSDKPDLRIDLELIEVSDLMEGIDFKVFAGPAKDPKGRVAALRVPNGSTLSRREIDGYTEYVSRYGAKGLAYIKVNDLSAGKEGLQSPIVKFIPDGAIGALLERTDAQNGDLIFFGADKSKVVNDALGALRVKLGHDLNIVDDSWQPLWVVDFPMFERDEKNNRWAALHHPFTAPSCSSEELINDPENALSRAYDMILNGTELGGGSIRIHDQDMQKAVFKLLDISDEEAESKFGFLLEALKFGCPPHGGIAFGMDRLIMLMVGATSIRDVMAFPKTQTASCPLTSAPAPVSEMQLKDLNINIRKPRIIES